MRQIVQLLAAVLFTASAVSAQSSSANDPISGNWKGDIGLDEATRFPVTLQLRFDGNAISGTVTGPGPAVLKSGSFDSKTGAFRLELGVQDGSQQSPFIFEGIAVKGMATGRVNGNNQTGTFRLTRDDSPPVGGPAGSVAEIRVRFDEVRAWVTRAAQTVPADKYAYQPTKSVRTFGQLIGHIIDGSNYYCGRAAGGQAQWSEANEKGTIDKAAILPKLEQALAACGAQYNGNGQPGALVDNVAHTSLHYGNVITYMRLLGLTPPSS